MKPTNDPEAKLTEEEKWEICEEKGVKMKIEIEELDKGIIVINDGNHSVSIVENISALDFHLAKHTIRCFSEMMNRHLSNSTLTKEHPLLEKDIFLLDAELAKLGRLGYVRVTEELREKIAREIAQVNCHLNCKVEYQDCRRCPHSLKVGDQILALITGILEAQLSKAIPIIRAEAFKAGKQEGQQQSIDTLNDYAKKKISLERCAELMDMNIYELLAAFRQWGSIVDK